MERARTKSPGIWLAPLLLLAPSAPARAVDGVVEINQARALAGGVTAGDGPGFPVTIDEAGSYRLTSDLHYEGGQYALQVATGHVTVDLNGFSVRGGPGSSSTGVLVGVPSPDVEIRNGTIRDFGYQGMFVRNEAVGVRLITTTPGSASR